jgi:hypothetical protein
VGGKLVGEVVVGAAEVPGSKPVKSTVIKSYLSSSTKSHRPARLDSSVKPLVLQHFMHVADIFSLLSLDHLHAINSFRQNHISVL